MVIWILNHTIWIHLGHLEIFTNTQILNLVGISAMMCHGSCVTTGKQMYVHMHICVTCISIHVCVCIYIICVCVQDLQGVAFRSMWGLISSHVKPNYVQLKPSVANGCPSDSMSQEAGPNSPNMSTSSNSESTIK